MTTKPFFKSRLIIVALVAIMICASIQLVASAQSRWAMNNIVKIDGEGDAVKLKIAALQEMSRQYADIDVLPIISGIVIALIARYGLRETTANIGQRSE